MTAPLRPIGKTTLTIETIGHEQILGPQQVAQILDAVAIDVASWVQNPRTGHLGFSRALNDFIDQFLALKLETKSDLKERRKLQRMRSYLEDYMDAAQKLRHSSFPPPYLPKDWFDSTMGFYDGLQARFDERSSGGRVEAAVEWEFIGKCAALFSLAFDVEPTSSVPGTRRETGAFSRFLVAIDQTCRERLLVPGTASNLLSNSFRHEVFLAVQSVDRLRRLINKALQYERVYPEDHDQSNKTSTYWVRYKKLIQDIYINIDSEQQSLRKED